MCAQVSIWTVKPEKQTVMACLIGHGCVFAEWFKSFVYVLLVVDVAWDWVNQKLYWTDPCDRDIEVFDPVSEQRRVLFNSSHGLMSPSGIVIDPGTGYAKAFYTISQHQGWFLFC